MIVRRWYTGSMRNAQGQFTKGHRASPATEFKRGQHWRKRKPFWNRDWLYDAYVTQQRSAADIASEFRCRESNILYWLAKHDIPRRSISQTRAVKHWGASGQDNPMSGKRGPLSSGWKGGITPERQAFYSSLAWAQAVEVVRARDGSTCQRCGAETNGRKGHIHHLAGWNCVERRADPTALCVLCSKCHGWVHSKRNTQREFLLPGAVRRSTEGGAENE